MSNTTESAKDDTTIEITSALNESGCKDENHAKQNNDKKVEDEPSWKSGCCGIIILIVFALIIWKGCLSGNGVERERLRDEEAARSRQQDAARELGLPVELTVDLPNGVKMEFMLIPTRGVCMTCTGTYGNGAEIGTREISTAKAQRMTQRAQNQARAAFFVVGAGTTPRGTAVRRTGTAAIRAFGSTASASDLPWR